jgi:phospholipase C
VAAPLLFTTLAPERADAGTDPLPLRSSPCGWDGSGVEPSYRHVIWIWMENHSYDQVLHSAHAPFENSLASACGLATSYHAVAHPSLPNYLAATSGRTFGVHSDVWPPRRLARAPSLFGELRTSGRQWRTYAESMPGNCAPHGPHGYARNPAADYQDAAPQCSRWDVPMGTLDAGPLATALRGGRLPAFNLILPNLCHSTHSCRVAAGDAWLSRLVTHIVHSPAYRHGHTVVFLTWDEGKHDLGQHIPLIVVSPTTPRGSVSSTRYDHYSLLRTTAELLHVPAPGHARDARSMRPAFGL